MAAMNRIGYDAMAVAHEFDFGLAVAERARQDARFPWLAANILNAEGARVPGDARQSLDRFGWAWSGSVRRRSFVAGLVGDPRPALRVSGHAARREVERLRNAERCDVIVVLAHTGSAAIPSRGRGPG